MLKWVGMDKQALENRKRKAREIRTCRKYLKRATEMGLTENSTTVRFWTQRLQEVMESL